MVIGDGDSKKDKRIGKARMLRRWEGAQSVQGDEVDGVNHCDGTVNIGNMLPGKG